MWKDSYCIGVDKIDQQHKALFEMVYHLIQTVNENHSWEEQKEECRQSITFLKEYVVEHFADEEAYQEEIGYEGLAQHKKLHKDFTKEVVLYGMKLEQSSFDPAVVKNFLGLLTAWLIYHVADADQKIIQKSVPVISAPLDVALQWYLKSVSDVLHTMVLIDTSLIQKGMVKESDSLGEVFIALDMIGDVEGRVMFGYSKEFAIEMMKQMTSMEMTEIDEMVCSAMAEVSNIISGNAAMVAKGNGYEYDITPPAILTDPDMTKQIVSKNGILLKTPLGVLTVAAEMKH